MRPISLLNASKISKNYFTTKALIDVNFELFSGEVHALMGENGAGKTTLAKILSGIEKKDGGIVRLYDEEILIDSPAVALKHGISIVMQDFNLIPDLSVYENIYLGHENIYLYKIILNKKEAIKRTYNLLRLFNMELNINPSMLISDLSVAEQQIIEILKAVSLDSKIIILDEPTAALTNTEAGRLFEVIISLKNKGVGFIIVSHRFNEIFQISDRITVLRDGKLVIEGEKMKLMNERKLVNAMVGRDINDFFGEKKKIASTVCRQPVLQVQHLYDSYDYLKDISFEAYSGEILGISGLVGAGRTTLARCLFGADSRKSGNIFIDGKQIKKNSPRISIKHGLSFVTENRKEEGLFIELSIILNVVFAKTANTKGVIIKTQNEEKDTADSVKNLNIKIGHHNDLMKSLSGGNQQKVVLAKWLLTNPKVIILDEPTRGIDISAKVEIYNIIHELVSRGLCVVIISSELQEIIGFCDRVIVMRDGEFVSDMPISEASEEIIMHYASFGTKEYV